MKIIKIFLFSFFVICFASCSQKQAKITVSETDFNFENKYISVDIHRKKINHSSPENEKSIAFFNNKVNEILLPDIFGAIEKSVHDYVKFYSEADSSEFLKYEYISRDTLRFLSENYISLSIDTYQFFGGAHGNTLKSSLNYDIKNQRLLKTEDILNNKSTAEIETMLKAKFDKWECASDEIFPKLEDVSALSFSQDSVFFEYKEYTLGAYSCGSFMAAFAIKDLPQNSFLLKL